MTDMTAFESLIAEDVRDEVGPEETIDAFAIGRKARTDSTRWRFPSEFSALEFVAAGVIVALCSGLLLAGVLTVQQDGEVPPAAVTESPSPMTSEELLSGMVTEEVEPGVFRVVNDGVRDLAISVVGPGYSVEVVPDGSVWLSSEVGGPGVFRLGGESRSVIPGDPTTLESPIRVAPDGSLGVIAGYPDDRRGVFSFDGQRWTKQADTTERLEGLGIGPDGTVWVMGAKSDRCLVMASGECPDTFLMRLEDDGSLTTIEDWSDVYAGHAYPTPMVVSPDGDIWLIGDEPTGSPFGADVLLRFDGTAWEVFPLPEGFESHPMDTALGFGDDGTLWVHAGGFVRHDAPDLVRFDDPGWSLFTVPGGTRSDVSGRDALTVAPDGSFWLPGKSFDSGSPGVAHYDGTTATPYLVGSAPSDLAIAPDGSVWLYSESGMQGHIYVITPEAVATTE